MTATPFVVSCLKNNNLGWTGTEAFSVSTHALEQGLFKSLNPFRIKLVDFLFDALHIVEWIWLEKSAFEFVFIFLPTILITSGVCTLCLPNLDPISVSPNLWNFQQWKLTHCVYHGCLQFSPHTQSTDLLFLYAGHFSATCSPKKQMKRFLIIISSFETWQSFFLFHSQVTSVTSLTGLRLENWPKRYDMCECNFFYKQWELVFWCFY